MVVRGRKGWEVLFCLFGETRYAVTIGTDAEGGQFVWLLNPLERRVFALTWAEWDSRMGARIAGSRAATD